MTCRLYIYWENKLRLALIFNKTKLELRCFAWLKWYARNHVLITCSDDNIAMHSHVLIEYLLYFLLNIERSKDILKRVCVVLSLAFSGLFPAIESHIIFQTSWFCWSSATQNQALFPLSSHQLAYKFINVLIWASTQTNSSYYKLSPFSCILQNLLTFISCCNFFYTHL